jgi:hypothetical protein
MRKKLFATILSLAVLLVCTGLTNASAKPTIKNIRFESPSTTDDRIIFEMNGPHLPTGKALPGENPRVYFDFPDTTPANKVKTRMSANGNFVKQIRYAYHKGAKAKTRVVFDLVANQKMAFKQDFNPNTNTLIITLFLAGTEPEPIAVVSPSEPEPVIFDAQSEPEPIISEQPTQPDAPTEEAGKKVQPIEDVSIAVAKEPKAVVPETEPQVPPQAQDFTPTQPKETIQEIPLEIAVPEAVPESMPEPEQTPEPVKQEQMPQIASIPPSSKVSTSLDTPIEEATVIQPMSEVGIQDQASIKNAAPILHSIEFDPKSNRGEMISYKLNGFHPPVVFGIEEDVPRIVCFFKNTSAGDELKDMIGTNGRYVKNIKIGKYKNPDNIRVVLELVPGFNYDLQQVFFKDDNIFMMIINKAGKQISTQSN